eukprot:TRINITY_DN15782_c0_g1_i1.p1 TRINITY_DN15782_c0_g1~~TRINITY_DN15782_c0_g1_i1.p1  ORF type:complete len:588 (+),score=127.56 TRINITY_DN15782_c0_g1_i1:84-1847(+)
MDFDCLEFFKEEINSDSAAIKINAANNLHLIAAALGPAKTVSELIPYVTQVVTEEPLCNDDEFLFTVAKQYAVLSNYINGRDELLIAPLEHLAAQEETVIRDEAINSLSKVIERRPALAPEYLVPAVHRLATRSDFFTARSSACALLPLAYRFVRDDQKQDLCRAFTTLCADELPMVRRAAAHKLHDFVSVCSKAHLMNDLINVYKELSKEDTQDTIRVACVHATLVIAKMLSDEENRQHTLEVIREACADRSWRVRLTVVKNFDQMCKNFGPEITEQFFMAEFAKLLKDNEMEVRKEAVRVIETCLGLPQPPTCEQLQQYVLPQFQSLSVDAQSVRSALAHAIGPVAKVLGKDVTERQLLTLITDLLKDEFHDVRLNMAGHAGLICEVLTKDGMVHSLINTVQGLITQTIFNDNHWRIRERVVEQVPKLCRLFGQELFQTKLEQIFFVSLFDSVHSVRQAAVLHLPEICKTFGGQWTVEHLLPKLLEQYSATQGYVSRVTTITAVCQVANELTPEQLAHFIVPVLEKATKDSVPNVRFCACKQILELANNLNSQSRAVIKRCLLELEQDPDTDVQYYAQRALLAYP